MVITIFNTLADRAAELAGRQKQLERDRPHMNSNHYWNEVSLLEAIDKRLDEDIDEVLIDMVAFSW